jgi:hypothetical protein
MTADYKKTYYITSGMEGVPDDDSEFRQLALYLSNSLRTQGYTMSNRGSADLEIRLSYGADPLQTSDTHSEYYNNVTNRTKTVTETSTGYERFLDIVALRNGEQVWTVAVKSSGGSNDLLRVIPYMIVAAQGNIGNSSDYSVVIHEDDYRVQIIKGRHK